MEAALHGNGTRGAMDTKERGGLRRTLRTLAKAFDIHAGHSLPLKPKLTVLPRLQKNYYQENIILFPCMQVIALSLII
jgi:hypothetical protein